MAFNEAIEEVELTSYSCNDPTECQLLQQAMLKKFEELQSQIQANYLKIKKLEEDSR